MQVGLGADWLPSGSPSLLHEVKIARRVPARQGSRIGARRLVQMLTSQAASIAGLDKFLGKLRPGRPAGILVLERREEDPYETSSAPTPPGSSS